MIRGRFDKIAEVTANRSQIKKGRKFHSLSKRVMGSPEILEGF